MEGGAQLFHIEVFKVTSMVFKNGSWDTEVTYNVIEDEFGNLNSYGGDKWDYIHPLGEIICSHDDQFVSF